MKKQLSRSVLALATVPSALLMTAIPAHAADTTATPPSPEVYAVDGSGTPLNDVVFGGVSEARSASALNWSAEDLSDYAWTRMYGHSNSEYVAAGDNNSATKGSGFNAQIPQNGTVATSCDDATQKLVIHQLAAPNGYSAVKGDITVAQTVKGWIECSNTTNGGITFTPGATINDVPKIVIHNSKGANTDTNTDSDTQMGSNGNSIPNVAKVQAAAPEFGVPGMTWDATLSYASSGSGARDKTVDVATAEGVKDLTMGDYAFSDEMNENIPWTAMSSTDATSCDNSPAQLTVWEKTAPAGYQTIDKPATLCLIGGKWVQTATPDDSTGWIKYDTKANLIRFGELATVTTTPTSTTSTPAPTTSTPAPVKTTTPVTTKPAPVTSTTTPAPVKTTTPVTTATSTSKPGTVAPHTSAPSSHQATSSAHGPKVQTDNVGGSSNQSLVEMMLGGAGVAVGGLALLRRRTKA